MYLKYVYNFVLTYSLLSEALCDSELPVIIGAPPPVDSGHAKAQQMYISSTIDHKGPPCLPPSKAATRIKRGVIDETKAVEGDVIAIHRIDGTHRCVVFSKATKDDPIILSSDDSVRSTKIKAAPKKKKSKYIFVLDLSDDNAVATIDRVNTDKADVGPVAAENPYQEPGPTLKRKANELPTTCLIKKPAPAPELKLGKMASKKGKQHALSHAHKSVEDSGSESNFPDMLMTQGMHLCLTCDTINY